MGFFHNRNSRETDSVSLMTACVSDRITTFTPAPTPFSRSSLSDTHRFMVFFHNRNTLVADSATPTIYSVVDGIVSFTPTPIPRSRSSLSHTHNIHTPTLPTSTLLTFTFTCTQVLWLLSCLTRSRDSGVTTRPATRITTISTRPTQCM